MQRKRIYTVIGGDMNCDIFQLLMLILLLESEGIEQDLNSLIIIFLMLRGKQQDCNRSNCNNDNCATTF